MKLYCKFIFFVFIYLITDNKWVFVESADTSGRSKTCKGGSPVPTSQSSSNGSSRGTTNPGGGGDTSINRTSTAISGGSGDGTCVKSGEGSQVSKTASSTTPAGGDGSGFELNIKEVEGGSAQPKPGEGQSADGGSGGTTDYDNYKSTIDGDHKTYNIKSGKKCKLVKVEDKEVWKYDSSKFNGEHPVMITFDSKQLYVFFSNGSLEYKKDANGNWIEDSNDTGSGGASFNSKRNPEDDGGSIEGHKGASVTTPPVNASDDTCAGANGSLTDKQGGDCEATEEDDTVQQKITPEKINLDIEKKVTSDGIYEYKSEGGADKFKALGNYKFHKLYKGTHELKELIDEYLASEVEVTYTADGKILLTCLYGTSQRVVFNINDPSKAKRSVELNINTEQSGVNVVVETSGNIRTFTPGNGYAFSKVVAKASDQSVTKEFYIAANSGEYASKVEHKGIGQDRQSLEVHLLNNHVKKWKKLGANAEWEHDTATSTGAGTGSGAKTDTNTSGGSSSTGTVQTLDKTKLVIVTLKADGTESQNEQGQYELDDKHGALDYKFKSDSKCVAIKYDGKEIAKFDKDYPISAQFNLEAMSVLFIMRSEELQFYVLNTTDDKWEHMIDKKPVACVLDANASAGTSQYNCGTGGLREFNRDHSVYSSANPSLPGSKATPNSSDSTDNGTSKPNDATKTKTDSKAEAGAIPVAQGSEGTNNQDQQTVETKQFQCTSQSERFFWTKHSYAFNRVKVNTYTFHETECESEYAWKLVYTGIGETTGQNITLYLLNGRTKKFSRSGDGQPWAATDKSPVANVDLELSSEATSEFSCVKKDNMTTFTTRGGFYAFTKVKDCNNVLFEKLGDGTTATKVVAVGSDNNLTSAVINLSNGAVKKLYKNESSQWVEVPKLDKAKISFVTQKASAQPGGQGGGANDEYQLTESGNVLEYKFKPGVKFVGVKYDGKDVWKCDEQPDGQSEYKSQGQSTQCKAAVSVQFYLDLKLASVRLENGSLAMYDFVGASWVLAHKGMPKPVLLDVNSTESTSQFTVMSDSSRTFTPRPGFGFKKIIGQNIIFYETVYDDEYATKVVYKGYAQEKRDIEISLPSGKVMMWNKFDKHKFWKDVTTYVPMKLDIACKKSNKLWEYKEALEIGTYKSKVGHAFYLIYKNNDLVLDLSDAVSGADAGTPGQTGKATTPDGSASADGTSTQQAKGTQAGSDGSSSSSGQQKTTTLARGTLPTSEDEIKNAQKYVATSVQVKYENNQIVFDCGLLWSRCYTFNVTDPSPPTTPSEGTDPAKTGDGSGQATETGTDSQSKSSAQTIELDLMDITGNNCKYSYNEPDHTYEANDGYKFSKIMKDGKELKSFTAGKEAIKVEADFSDNSQIMLCIYESSSVYSVCFVDDPDNNIRPTPPSGSS